MTSNRELLQANNLRSQHRENDILNRSDDEVRLTPIKDLADELNVSIAFIRQIHTRYHLIDPPLVEYRGQMCHRLRPIDVSVVRMVVSLRKQGYDWKTIGRITTRKSSEDLVRNDLGASEVKVGFSSIF